MGGAASAGVIDWFSVTLKVHKTLVFYFHACSGDQVDPARVIGSHCTGSRSQLSNDGVYVHDITFYFWMGRWSFGLVMKRRPEACLDQYGQTNGRACRNGGGVSDVSCSYPAPPPPFVPCFQHHHHQAHQRQRSGH